MLAEAGFKNIELSGGTDYYPEYEADLLRLQDKYNLEFLVHNYFPPPREPFVLNLASNYNDIYNKSIDLCERAIALSKKLGGRRYGVHAGFIIEIEPHEVGRIIKKKPISDKDKALKRFSETINILEDKAGSDVKLYVENNVFSSDNAKSYYPDNPFLLTDYGSLLEMQGYADINLLLDIAHLKVSSNTLGLDFPNQMSKMLNQADYIHLSENNSLHDQNLPVDHSSNILPLLEREMISNKILTLEIYGSLEKIRMSHEIISQRLYS